MQDKTVFADYNLQHFGTFFKNLLAHSLIIFHHGEEHIQLWCFY